MRAYFLNQLLGIDPEADQKKIFALNENLKKMMAPPPAPRVPANSMAPAFRSLEVMQNDYYGRCEIVQDGTGVKIQFGPAKYPATLKHWNNGAFMMQFPGATQMPSVTTFMIG